MFQLKDLYKKQIGGPGIPFRPNPVIIVVGLEEIVDSIVDNYKIPTYYLNDLAELKQIVDTQKQVNRFLQNCDDYILDKLRIRIVFNNCINKKNIELDTLKNLIINGSRHWLTECIIYFKEPEHFFFPDLFLYSADFIFFNSNENFVLKKIDKNYENNCEDNTISVYDANDANYTLKNYVL